MSRLLEVEEEGTDDLVIEDKVRYRTFRVFKTVNETPLSNGNILIERKLLGRVVAVTVPVDESMEYFYVDFAFCSTKDQFSKEYGKNLAYTRLKEKITGEGDVYIIQKNDSLSITDVIKEIISTDFYDTITWLKGVRACDIM